ncbi:TetR family transcriptional regulator [Pseudomonas veronii]|uniref:TetR family transcriptional regulator n=1 Tax=Pseudomonas veronii TaxID=76761 RepID=UPI002D78EFCB|nr:TetR family transcriptional regulator [Pseudomonas veronii]WRU65432.1 TetR family transcriptional regulator [Pseudomonas veronii]
MNVGEKTSISKGELTRNAIRIAIIAITKGRPKVVSKDRKISIKAVAEEAGVSNATIHNNHPDLAEQIRRLANKDVREDRDAVKQTLTEQRKKAAELRADIAELKAQLAEIASVNASLMLENQQLKLRLISLNVHEFKR